ncbi:MAG: dihydroxy-acid dehydratase, partial [Devosiaceae bacterium]|nr:dihydroxy-acid dehydratase [Devosiaceae bacterium]
MAKQVKGKGKPKLRSRAWFDNPENPDMTAIYLERYLNFGLSRQELQSQKPIIGIAQTGSDLSPCNRHHIILADRVREGIREAGGIAIEFPVHPIQETGKRPTAGLDRNLAYLGLVELLHGYPLDGVVLTIGCDKTTPAMLMGAATVNIPAIALSVGPMLNGYYKGERTGSGTIVWKARQMLATGEIDAKQFIELVASSAPSTGFCNTMGTASTMNSLAEVLGMQLPGAAAIPAPYRDRQEISYRTGLRIVEMVEQDIKPSNILTRDSFLNAIAVNSAIGGSTNAPIHINAIARHMGVDLNILDWQHHGYKIPLLLNMQPAGKYLGEDFYRAGGVPAITNELIKNGKIITDAPTVNGKTIGENYSGAEIENTDVIYPYKSPLKDQAGFLVLKGNLFDNAIMKTSVISNEFRQRYLSNPDDLNVFEGKAVVFDGPEDYHKRIDDVQLDMDKNTIEKPEKIILSYLQNDLIFEYTGIHYSNPSKNLYKYKLEPYDLEWIEAGTQRMARYTNLDPGEYNFRVIGSNDNDVWNEKGASIQLLIESAWWTRWWAYIAYACLTVGLMVSIRRYELNRILFGKKAQYL